MIKIPAMFMVGAMGRNAGKTEFACSLIRHFNSQHPIIGVKVTTIEPGKRGCPRGGTGCGVCASLDGHYYISQETDPQTDKDTSRMLAAGAERVFWLRALNTHLAEATAALLDIVPASRDAVYVCESNSLRGVVEPGAFFIVKSKDAQDCKKSVKSVLKYADRIISFDGERFDVELDQIELIEGRWAAKMEATAIIIAGGDSSRMGRDKSMLVVKGKSMIEHIFEQLRPYFNQILISSNDPAKHGFLGVEVVGDRERGLGPLMGIASALRVSANELNFVIACDIPEVDFGVVRMMITEARNVDVVMPRMGPSKVEPLFAVYKKSVLSMMENALSAGKNRIIDPLEHCNVKYVDLTKSQSKVITNLNTMEDYHRFIEQESDIDK